MRLLNHTGKNFNCLIKSFRPIVLKFGLLILIFIEMSNMTARSQEIFRSPVDFNMVLSSNFGELRTNHFHSGIDIKTYGRIGYSMYAIADGHVSRIRVSAYGYGLVVYLTHNNGYQSVYAHLSKFSPKIEAYIEQEHKQQKKFELDLYPDSSQFVVKKGDVIGFSGNSGRSGGPHIHFEVRQTATEYPLNPMLFYSFKDNTPPRVHGIYYYDLCNRAASLAQVRQKINLIKSGNTYTTAGNTPVLCSAECGFSIAANDYMDASYNPMGVYKMQVYKNDSLLLGFRMDAFSFYESKYINSLMDYELYTRYRVKNYKTFREPGNKLSIYHPDNSDGVIRLSDGETANLRIELWDIWENKTTIKLKLKQSKPCNLQTHNTDQILSPFNGNYIIRDDVRILIPEGALYQVIPGNIITRQRDLQPYSNRFSIGDVYTPLHERMIVNIRIRDEYINIADDLIIVRLDEEGQKQALYSTVIDSFLTAKSSYFGDFYIDLDNEAPKIVPLQDIYNKNISYLSQIDFTITDNLCGIDKYQATIDNQLITFKHDAKNKRFTIDLHELSKNQWHSGELLVTDNCGNTNRFPLRFYY